YRLPASTAITSTMLTLSLIRIALVILFTMTGNDQLLTIAKIPLLTNLWFLDGPGSGCLG
ncbi:hypothetical protein ACFL3A_11320, partial [Pseudomonadota bacterium]